MALVTTAIYGGRLGKAGGLTDDVRTVTGTAPIAFADWAAENRSTWMTDD